MGRKSWVNNNIPTNVRVRKRSNGRVYYFYDCGGKPRKEISLGSNYIEALKKWAELESGNARAPKEVTTFKLVAEAWMKDELHTKAPKTQEEYTRQTGKLIEFFNDPPAPIDQIEPVHVNQYMRWRKGAPVAATCEKAVLSSIWNWARANGYTAKPNPCAGIKGKKAKRRVYIEDEVYDLVREHASEELDLMMQMAYLVGHQPIDLIALTDADVRNGELHIARAKTGERTRLAITGELEKLLARIAARKKKFKVYPMHLLVTDGGKPFTKDILRSRFTKARDAAAAARPDLEDAVRNFQFRDLRAKAGTDKAEREGIYAAQQQLAHASVTTTEIYAGRKGRKATPTR